MNPHSFYVGPGKPVLRATGWDDVVAAAQTGALAETQWVELKVALPASASAPNLELARDLASLSIDGGVLVIGVKDPGNQADHVVGTTDDLEGLKSRIDQVAGGTRVQPRLNVQFGPPIVNPSDPSRYVLIVSVPASASAPHMVDEKYWGRSATGKRPLADVEVNRLIVERRGRRDDFRERLEALSTDLDPLPPAQRRYGHLYVMVEPESAWLGPPLSDVIADKLPMQVVLDSLSFNAQLSPSFSSLRYPVPHPDGVALAALSHDQMTEEYLLHLLLTDSGSIQLASGQDTRRYRDEIGISVNYIMEIVHQMLRLAAHLGSTYLHYGGTWKVGVHVQGLKGLFPSQALTESGALSMRRFSPFQAASYTRTDTATTTELAERTPTVVENLLRDLARGVGLQGYFFPYTNPSEIFQKA